jgi:hypothetical protein
VKQAIFAAALLMPIAAAAQPAQPPGLQAQVDAAAMQGTRVIAMLAGQIAADQQQIADLQKEIADLRAKLTAKDAPAPLAKKD